MPVVTRCQPLMGTYVEISLAGKENKETLHAYCNHAFKVIYQAQTLMSFHDITSELSQINRLRPNESLKIHPWTYKVIRHALELSQHTDGIYDITVGRDFVRRGLLPGLPENTPPDKAGNWENIHLHPAESTVTLSRSVLIDLGGIAKGFAVDEAIKTLSTLGLSQAIVNAGGDMKMLHPEGKKISIRVSGNSGHRFIGQPMLSSAVATSSNTYHKEGQPSYIVDPRKRKFIDDFRNISVFANPCMVADALTKAAFLLTERKLDKLLKIYHATVVILP